MKTKFYLLVFIFVATFSVLHAQLKVISNGSVSIGYTGYSNIWLGSQPNSVALNGFDSGKWAFEIWGENLNVWKPYPSQNNGELNYYMFLTPSGAVGVGKVPTHQSEICIDVNGLVYSYGVALTSDERLKTDIKPLTDKLDKLYQLNGKSYIKNAVKDEVSLSDIVDEKGNVIKKFEKSKDKKTQQKAEFGFLAQELKEVYPELVTKDTLGYYYVNYIGLIPVLVEALKEQKAEIEALKTQISGNSGNIKKVGGVAVEPENINYPVLEQNVPNPFSVDTEIKYSLPESVQSAGIYVYDMNGNQLKHYPLNSRGNNTLIIKGSELSAGMYLYALITDGKVIDTKRMILTK